MLMSHPQRSMCPLQKALLHTAELLLRQRLQRMDWNNNIKGVQHFMGAWTSCTCVWLETAEHTSTRLGPVQVISKQTSVGSKRNGGSVWLGHLAMSDGDLCQHIVLLHSHQPRERMRQGQSSTVQTDLTNGAAGIPLCTPQCDQTAWIRGKPH